MNYKISVKVHNKVWRKLGKLVKESILHQIWGGVENNVYILICHPHQVKLDVQICSQIRQKVNWERSNEKKYF